ncbi:MAG: hypothetical protein IPL65_20195 [Lewinellaceae bacterium]|nr:hypothetical protein [Lewinellaceae bacterium]
MKAFELHFQYSETDFNEFLWHYVVKGRGRRMMWWMVIAVLVLGFTFWWQGKMTPSVILTMGVALVFFTLMWRWFLFQTGKKNFKMNPQMQEKRRCQIHAKGFDMHGETFNALYVWSEVQRLAETPNLFLLYTSPMSQVK